MYGTLLRGLAVLVVLCLAFQAPVPAAAAGELQEARRRREKVNERLDSARDNLAETRREQRRTLSRLRRIADRRAQLEAQLERLNGELAEAEALVAEAEAAVRRTQAEIDVATDELALTERRLEIQRDRLKARARATFMHGGANYPETILDIETANELSTSLSYMRSILEQDRDEVEQTSTLEHKYEATIARLDDLRAAQDAARAEREQERDRVAGLVAERREVVSQLDAQAREQQAVLSELERDERRYAAAVDELEAQSEAIRARLAAIASGAPRASSGRFQWPVNGRITSSFGYRTHPVLGTRRLHAGVDFGAAAGTPIVAAESGTVVSAGWMGGYGNAVVIDHGGGVATLYGHQSRLAVGSGARVSRGEVIGYVGSTGMSTGPHLHFEMRIRGVPNDPLPRLQG